jgi:hypothetical protein
VAARRPPAVQPARVSRISLTPARIRGPGV